MTFLSRAVGCVINYNKRKDIGRSIHPMDSYTDVSGQCCGCGCRHVSCNTSSQNDSGSYWQPDYPDMNTVPWAVSDNNTVPSYSYMDQTYPDMDQTYPDMDQTYPNMNQMVCVSTEPGCLEQQFPVAMAYVPWQQWQTTYAPERGLVQGTIFPDLDLQFNYGRCSR